ncbi:MAG: hypothetical protein ACLVD2_04305 [Blautia sp.]
MEDGHEEYAEFPYYSKGIHKGDILTVKYASFQIRNSDLHGGGIKKSGMSIWLENRMKNNHITEEIG